MRVFVALDISQKAKDEIRKIQEQLPKFDGKLTEKENLHLTLKFLGEVSNENIEEVKKRLGEIRFNKFETEINHLGFFDNSKSEPYNRKLIVWLHLTNCEELQSKIDGALSGLFDVEKRFMSHLTIARVKNVENKKEFLDKLEKIKINKIKFDVKDFKLKKSILTPEGPIHENLEIYPLEQ